MTKHSINTIDMAIGLQSRRRYGNVTRQPWSIKSATKQLFVQHYVQTNIKE